MKPLLVLDCDGVILEFMAPFNLWLERSHGLRAEVSRPGIAIRIIRLANGATVDKAQFPVLLDDFFAHGLPQQTPIPGVLPALERLARDAEIVVLTNIPHQWRHQREAQLVQLGLHMPVYSNQGPKGRRLAELTAGRRAIFVDDMAVHLQSAAEQAPRVARMQMVADPALTQLVPPSAAADARIDDWRQAEQWIRNSFEGARA